MGFLISSNSTLFTVALIVAMLAGTLRATSRNLVHRPAMRVRGRLHTVFKIAEWILWVISILMLVVAVPHPAFPLILALLVTALITGWHARYQEEKRSINHWIRIGSERGAPMADLLDLLANSCGSRVAIRAKLCAQRLWRGEGFADAVRRSGLPIDGETMAFVLVPTMEGLPVSSTKNHRDTQGGRGRSPGVSDRSRSIFDDQLAVRRAIHGSLSRVESGFPESRPLLAQNATYVVVILVLAWAIGWLVRIIIIPQAKDLSNEFSENTPLYDEKLEWVGMAGHWIVALLVIWIALACMTRWLPIWTVPFVPWFGRDAINRWRCEALQAIENGTRLGEPEGKTLGCLAKVGRPRWVRVRSRKTAALLDQGVPLPMALQRGKLIRRVEQTWLTSANENRHLADAIRRLREDIGRRQQMRWQVRLSWLVPLATILVGIYVLAHAIFLFHFFAVLMRVLS